MGATAERFAVAIDVTKDTDAIGQTVAEVNAANAKILAANESQYRLTKQQRADMQAAINEDVALLQLKARALDVTSQAGVRAWMDEARAIREAVAAEQGQERTLLNIDLAMKSVTARVGAMEAAQARAASAVQRVNTTINGIPGEKIRMGAQAASTLAFSLEGVGGNAKTAAFALGNVAQVVSMMAGTAKIAAWSAGIGAAVTVLGSLVGLIQEANRDVNAPDSFLNRLQHWDLHMAEAQLAALQARAASLRQQIEQGSQIPTTSVSVPVLGTIPLPGKALSVGADRAALKDYEGVLKEIEETTKRVTELRTQENKSLRDNARELRVQADTQLAAARAALAVRGIELKIAEDRVATIGLGFDKERAEAEAAYQAKTREIQQQFTIRDSTGQIVALTADQRRQREQLLALAQADYDVQRQIIDAQEAKAGDARLRAQTAYQLQTQKLVDESLQSSYAVRYAEILEEARVAEEAGQRKVDVERRTQAEIRKLQRDTFQASVGYLGQFSSVLLQSKSREIKAVGWAAENMRRVIIGAEGAHSAVLALKEGAAALASAGSGNFGAAALHAASAVQYAAAAALAAQESLGGGRTASGAAAGGGGSPSTFEPSASGGGGNLVINLITRDPYGKDAIAETVYELQQFGDLKRTIPVAPTRGVRVAGVGA